MALRYRVATASRAIRQTQVDYNLPLGGMSLGDYKATGVLRPVAGRGRSVNFGLAASF